MVQDNFFFDNTKINSVAIVVRCAKATNDAENTKYNFFIDGEQLFSVSFRVSFYNVLFFYQYFYTILISTNFKKTYDA